MPCFEFRLVARFVEREKMTHNKVEPRYFSLLLFWLGEDNKKKTSIGLLRKNINSSLGYLPRDEVFFYFLYMGCVAPNPSLQFWLAWFGFKCVILKILERIKVKLDKKFDIKPNTCVLDTS